MPDDRSGNERALDLLVFGPIGLAAYVRDTAPSFLRLFVARGRAVVDGPRQTVEDQLGQARTVGEFATVYGAPHVRRLVTEALASARARAEETIELLGGLAGTPKPAPAATSPADGRPGPAPPPGAPTAATAHLAIRDYDELSASQVVERLDGLSDAELDAIRAHEASHRARNTVLGKIEQLTRPVG